MSLLQLRQAALAPTLWRNRIQGGVIDDLNAIYESIESSFPNGDVTPPPGPLYVSRFYTSCDAFLIPGGRFFVTQSDGHIHLYDLGSGGAPNRVLQAPIASQKVDLGDDNMVMQLPMFVVPMDETRVRVVVGFVRRSLITSGCVLLESFLLPRWQTLIHVLTVKRS